MTSIEYSDVSAHEEAAASDDDVLAHCQKVGRLECHHQRIAAGHGDDSALGTAPRWKREKTEGDCVGGVPSTVCPCPISCCSLEKLARAACLVLLLYHLLFPPKTAGANPTTTEWIAREISSTKWKPEYTDVALVPTAEGPVPVTDGGTWRCTPCEPAPVMVLPDFTGKGHHNLQAILTGRLREVKRASQQLATQVQDFGVVIEELENRSLATIQKLAEEALTTSVELAMKSYG